MSAYFSVLIDDELVTFEKSRIIAIEPSGKGSKLIIRASHNEEEPFIYFSKEPYEQVIQAYTS